MPKQGWFETDEDYRKHVEYEALEKASGSHQGLFESDEDYAARARREALEKATGSHQGLFESDEDYAARARREALEKTTGSHQGLFESDEDYAARARREALEKATGSHQGLFESEEDFLKRAERELGEDLTMQKSHIYVQQSTSRAGKEAPDVQQSTLRADKEAPDDASSGAAANGTGTFGLLAAVGLVVLLTKYSDPIAFLIAVVLPLLAGLLIRKPWYILRGGLLGYALVGLISFLGYAEVLPSAVYENTPKLYPIILLGMLGGFLVKKRRKSR